MPPVRADTESELEARPDGAKPYVEWAHERAVPSQRLGMVSSALVFAVVLAVTCALGAAGRVPPREVLGWCLSLVVPLGVIALGSVALDRGRRPYSAWFVVSNAVNSVFLVLWARGVGTGDGDAHVLLCGALSTLFICGVGRQLPSLALAASSPGLVVAGLLHVRSWSGGRIEGATLAVDLIILLVALGIGAVLAVGSDVQNRAAHQQEGIIEAQRKTIAKQRHLLEKELSHQVAERSRDLGAALASSDRTLHARSLTVGERFAERYKVVAALGSGGMGAVYEVERTTDAARFALKVVTGPVSSAGAARFAREAEIGARLRHPNLISIVDVGMSEGAPFLVMELVEGGSLEAQRSRFGDVEWALPLLRQIADGLVALHDAGVVHRDLKPANVLLDAGVARISDFGISRLGGAEPPVIDGTGDTLVAAPSRGVDLTGTGVLLGTPLYMAPEGAKSARALDASADVFAFGIIAYEMLTGRLPFQVPAILTTMAEQPIPPPAPIRDERVSPALRSAVARALATDPAERPRVRALVAALG